MSTCILVTRQDRAWASKVLLIGLKSMRHRVYQIWLVTARGYSYGQFQYVGVIIYRPYPRGIYAAKCHLLAKDFWIKSIAASQRMTHTKLIGREKQF